MSYTFASEYLRPSRWLPGVILSGYLFSGQLLLAQGGTGEDKSGLSWVGKELAGMTIDKDLADPFYDKIRGNLNMSEFERRIEFLIERDKEHEEQYRRLRKMVNENMPRAKVEETMIQVLREINPRLAEHAQQIRDLQIATGNHQKLLKNHQQLLNELQKDVGLISLVQKAQREEYQEGLSMQGARITRVESEYADIRRDYPRWKPSEQAEHLGVAGMQFLLKGDNREAMRSLRFAHAFDPTEPGCLYALAVLHRREGKNDTAEILLARAVAAERRRPLTYNRWWKTSLERFQGPDRSWVEAARSNAIYGVFVPGTIRIPDSMLGQ